MGYMPAPQAKTRRMLEAYRKDKRRKTAMVAGVGCLALAVLAAVIIAVLLLRTCVAGQDGAARFVRDPSDPRWAREVAVHRFKPAPWFIALDDERVYTGQDRACSDVGYLTFPMDTLAAFPLMGGDAAWEWQFSGELNWFGVAGPSLCGFRSYLVEPPRIELVTFDVKSGVPGWRVTLEGADEGAITADEKVAVLGYRLQDGYRLAGYNTESGAKAWGMKPPMRDLVQDSDIDRGAVNLHLSLKQGILAYWCNNVIGLVDAGSGTRMNERNTTGRVLDVALDPSAQACYFLTAGNQLGTYMVQTLPFDGGGAATVYRFASSSEDVLLYTAGGYVLLSYTIPSTEGGKPLTKLVCYDRHLSEPVLAHQFEEGVISDVNALPGDGGDFIVALNRGTEENGQPTGWGELYRTRLSEGTIEKAARFRRPVQYLTRFKQDCLVLLRGGEIISYIAGSNTTHRIKRAAYPQFWLLHSSSKQHLMIISYPDDYLRCIPGQPMQVIVYE